MHTEKSDKYADVDRKLAFLIYPGLNSVFPDKLDEVLDANQCNYSRNDATAFQLMIEYACYPKSHLLSDSIVVDDCLEYIENHADKATAVRYAITQAVIAKLSINLKKI
jgi:hypothetical protein